MYYLISLILLFAVILFVNAQDVTVPWNTGVRDQEIEIDIGDSVTWNCDDTAQHTVRTTDAPDGGAFNSGDIDIGGAFEIEFTIPGIYEYECANHPTMTGTLTVNAAPTIYPTINPTMEPTDYPTIQPSINPTDWPTINPSINPTINPTIQPTVNPTINPSINPTDWPTINPSINPTDWPTINPSINPTVHPTIQPSINPSIQPSINPTNNPTIVTVNPSIYPTANPSSGTIIPSIHPTTNPTLVTVNPTMYPSIHPSIHPTGNPSGTTISPSIHPTNNPTGTSVVPTIYPTVNPVIAPSINPTNNPTIGTVNPSSHPTRNPSAVTPAPTTTASPTKSPVEQDDDIVQTDDTGNTGIQILDVDSIEMRLSLTINVTSEMVDITLWGPVNRWYGVGFGDDSTLKMADTYTIFVYPGLAGIITERSLGNHNVGTEIAEFDDTSESINGNVKTITVTRPISSDNDDVYDFPVDAIDIYVIAAYGAEDQSPIADGATMAAYTPTAITIELIGNTTFTTTVGSDVNTITVHPLVSLTIAMLTISIGLISFF